MVRARGPARAGPLRGLRLPARARLGRRGGAGGGPVRLALYARVSTDAQEVRGTVASQLELLRQAAQAAGDEVIAEFVDEGYSGARLDRPALDRLRDAAAAGLIEQVVCLCPDLLARSYAYQLPVPQWPQLC